MGKTVPRRRRRRWEATITYYKISRITSRITSHSHTLTTCNPHSINFFSPMPTQVHCVQTWLWRGEGKEREIQWDGRAGLPNRRPQQKDSSSKLRVENCQTLLRVIIYFYFSSCSRRSDVQYIYICIYCLCAPHIPRVVIDCDGCPGLSRCGDWWRHDARQPRPAAVGVHCTVPTIFNFIFFLSFALATLFFFFFSHFNSRMSIFV